MCLLICVFASIFILDHKNLTELDKGWIQLYYNSNYDTEG